MAELVIHNKDGSETIVSPSKMWSPIPRSKTKLTQAVFRGMPPEVIVACVDYDGLLKFGDSHYIRYTWASERWRGANWLFEKGKTEFEPLTLIYRDLGEDHA